MGADEKNDFSKNTRQPGSDERRDDEREWLQEEATSPRRKTSDVPLDAPEADVLEQEREWVDEGSERPRAVPIDAPEADVLDQSRPADLDDEGRHDG